MTGYASATREFDAGTLTLELRSVNSRFLDLQFRMNDELRSTEPVLREAIMARITRGKVECRLSFGRKAPTGGNGIHIELLNRLIELQEQVLSRLPQAAPMSVNELLRWPGMMDEAAGADNLQADVAALGRDVLDAFVESRRREGAALEAMLLSRIDEMEAIVSRITPLVPQAVEQFRQKATERMQEALGIAVQNGQAGAQPALPQQEVLERIRQEVTLYGIRVDVAEELGRLAAHLSETRHILKKGGQVGKRLDFMMQELNREANTLGSKAAVKELADASMALKLLIEQMREQVQNLE
ncbi:YicC/YloC family endoribonuclease [Noviherbaspirillum pedocola]|uniref:YicC family protein n=1 Tax=Noviherbaspirillum pedocola TaxID=2801341 RepID=A0A934T0I4_9BURK|nr:YicC/YloC family endoribonuclease [Noviherbaspirillum pedocola]MBK4736259.1 YicC family protein [Noviherbaspirillum pedocola]